MYIHLHVCAIQCVRIVVNVIYSLWHVCVRCVMPKWMLTVRWGFFHSTHTLTHEPFLKLKSHVPQKIIRDHQVDQPYSVF